jgi:Gluconate 2-dehydrogenase subunit 3
MTRRELIQLLASVPLLAAAEPGKPLFFTLDEFALLDALTELIIPTDKHSPGARAAGVAAFIDRVTAEAFPGEEKTSWQDGLRKIEESALALGSKFLALPITKQTQILKKLDEANDPFFGQLKQTTAFVYYSSSIGIHEDMEYKGNVILQEFAGYPV